MIPQAGSAYAYSYATLGEVVAWIIGWDLILEYAVGNVAVAIAWADTSNRCSATWAGTCRTWLATGYRDGAAQSRPGGARTADHGAAHRRHPDPDQRPGLRDRGPDHLAAAARRSRERRGPTT